MTVGKDMEKRESMFTSLGNVNWYRHYGKHYEYFSKDKKRKCQKKKEFPLDILFQFYEMMVDCQIISKIL